MGEGCRRGLALLSCPSVERGDFDAWVGRYVRAWDSNEPAHIAALFTDDAKYYTAPFRQPWSGQEAIVSGWLKHRDKGGDHRFRHEVLGTDGEVGFVRGWTAYDGQSPPSYSNLWVIRLENDGRASEFTEWWMVNSA